MQHNFNESENEEEVAHRECQGQPLRCAGASAGVLSACPAEEGRRTHLHETGIGRQRQHRKERERRVEAEAEAEAEKWPKAINATPQSSIFGRSPCSEFLEVLARGHRQQH